MPREYRTIEEAAGPLLLVKDVEGATYGELAEIRLKNGEKDVAVYLKLTAQMHLYSFLRMPPE